MKPGMIKLLDQASSSLEMLAVKMDNLNEVDLADVGGRMKGIEKAATEIRNLINESIKKSLNGTDGELLGHHFKAIISSYDKKRFETKRFCEENPKIAAKYTVSVTESRLTFEPR